MAPSLNIVHSTGPGAIVIQDGRPGSRPAETGEAGDRATPAATPDLASAAAAGPTAAELAGAVATLAMVDGARSKKLGTLHRDLLRDSKYRRAFVALRQSDKLPRRDLSRPPKIRTGKIGRLPHELRERVNRRLQQGEPARWIAEWLNAQPEAVAMLARDWKGRPITTKSVREWYEGGYQDWLKRQEDRA